MTHETPAKVMSLLGIALTSMALLFAVSATNADFSGTRVAVADPFSADKVVAVLDNTSAAYNRFLSANLFQPLGQTYALVSDNVGWISSNAHDGFVAMVGLQQPSVLPQTNAPLVGRVAGAHTSSVQQQSQQSGVFDVVLSAFTQ